MTNALHVYQKRWPIFLLATGTLIPLICVGTATASLLPGGIGSDWQQWVLDSYPDPLEQLLGQLGKSDPITQTIMDVALGEGWQELKTITGSDIPDPYQIRTTEASTGSGVLTKSPIIRQRDLANLYDQETGRAMAAPVLGEQGQEWLSSETQQTSTLISHSQQTTEQAQQLAQDAQGLGVTQDVMKQAAQIDAAIASLLTQQTQLTGDNHATLLQLQQLQGILTQLSANTSEGIDESNRRARLERQISLVGSTQAPVYIPGLLGTGQPAQE